MHVGPVSKKAGDVIIKQGDIGDVFYLLEEGLVDVFVSKNKAPDIKVHTYTPGNSFGELALMYNAPRAATCSAQTDCVLWTLDRISFKVIVIAATMQKRDAYSGFLRQVNIFSTLSEMEVMTIADSLTEKSFVKGEVIFNQGDLGENFLIIKEGQVKCSQKDSGGESKIIASLSVGDYFGEIAILNAAPRLATVTASENVALLSLDKATFVRVMGPLEEILKRNMVEYYKFNPSQTV